MFRFPSCEIFWRRSTCWTRPSGSHSTSVSPTPSYKTDSNQHPSAGPLLGPGTWRFKKISDRNEELEFVGDRNIKIRIFVDRNVKIQNFVWTGTNVEIRVSGGQEHGRLRIYFCCFDEMSVLSLSN